MARKKSKIGALVLVLLVVVLLDQLGCMGLKARIIQWMTPQYEPALKVGPVFSPVFDELDLKRERIDIVLTPVAKGFIQITDLQFVPNHDDLLIVLEKSGNAKWVNLADGKTGRFFEREVTVASEQGLLGLAFDPDFAKNGRFYINETIKDGERDLTRIVALEIDSPGDIPNSKPQAIKTILELEQPYANHNAGQLAFGPDGYLYIGFGDGGWADDPQGNGQNAKALLGKMLRIDVSNQDERPYVVPSDNPFVNDSKFAPEIWAWGLRNPWKYSFDPDGRLVVADVGQNKYEEISILHAGANAGWKNLEASHCFDPKEDCLSTGMTGPVYEYGRDDGGSITGGFVATSDHVAPLKDLYVFADFLSGRMWAIKLPSSPEMVRKAFSLGRWSFLPSTFGRDGQGRLYVGAFRDGVVYRLDPA
jgi:glucose/arabinose dehydrogenase